MSMESEVVKLIFAVLDVSFNSGHYTVIIKRQLLYINSVRLTDIMMEVLFDSLTAMLLIQHSYNQCCS